MQGLFRLLLLARGNPLNRVVGADQAWQARRAAVPWNDAELDFRLTDSCRFRHDPVIANQTHLESSTKGDTVDGGHCRYRQILKGIKDIQVNPENLVRYLSFACTELRGEFRDVRAHDENRLATCNDHTVERCISRDCRSRLLQLVDRQRIELVD